MFIVYAHQTPLTSACGETGCQTADSSLNHTTVTLRPVLLRQQETWGHFQLFLWFQNPMIFRLSCGQFKTFLWRQNQVFLKDTWGYFQLWWQNRLLLTACRLISSRDCGDQNRYFKPNHDIFPTLYQMITTAWAQRCDKRETENST